MSDFVIIGDTKDYDGCLVCVCGTQDHANEVLDRMLNNPNDNDKRLIDGYYNLRVKEVPKEDCWWRGNCD